MFGFFKRLGEVLVVIKNHDEITQRLGYMLQDTRNLVTSFHTEDSVAALSGEVRVLTEKVSQLQAAIERLNAGLTITQDDGK